MTLPSWAADEIQLITPALIEDHGSLVVDPDQPGTTTPVPGCSVQPEEGEEVRGERDQVREAWRVFAPAVAPITEGSIISWNSRQYSVDGVPLEWRSPTGAVDHLEFVMWRWRDVYPSPDPS